MPTHPASGESLAYYHEQFGPSWYSFDQMACHFIILNSQILNADLPETDAQWAWFESDLQAHRKKRCFLFFHLPIYLYDINEPGLGHYDNINSPERERLHALIATHAVELVMAGHVHYRFYDHIGKSRYLTAPSPAFTRPGFAHLFASSPPNEQGRDDTGKLGFYFVRVFPDRTDIHFIRTHGAEKHAKSHRLVTGLSASLPNSPVGLTLSHPITPTAEVPLAYPSAVRCRVRNDIHLLSAVECGATSVRFPWRDLLDPFLRARLQMLKSEGIALTATFLEPRIGSLPDLIHSQADLVQTWEIQLPGATVPSPEICRTLTQCMTDTQLALCPIISNERVRGKQHLRTRIGFNPDDLVHVNARLQNQDVHLSRVLCRVPPHESPWDVVKQSRTYSNISHVDLAIELTSQDEMGNAARIAEACFAVALMPTARLFFSPYIDLDRTMDAFYGLLDTQGNPRLAFHALRCLNTLLFSPIHNRQYHPVEQKEGSNFSAFGLESVERKLILVIPHRTPVELSDVTNTPGQTHQYHLGTGEHTTHLTTLTTRDPVLITT
jgi:hypothetical protein